MFTSASVDGNCIYERWLSFVPVCWCVFVFVGEFDECVVVVSRKGNEVTRVAQPPFALSVQPSSTIRQVKEQVYEQQGVEVPKQRLRFQNSLLSDDTRTLEGCGIGATSGPVLLEVDGGSGVPVVAGWAPGNGAFTLAVNREGMFVCTL